MGQAKHIGLVHLHIGSVHWVCTMGQAKHFGPVHFLIGSAHLGRGAAKKSPTVIGEKEVNFNLISIEGIYKQVLNT